jgi:hypothetical protein
MELLVPKGLTTRSVIPKLFEIGIAAKQAAAAAKFE